MMKFNRLFISALAAITFFTSCSSDDDLPPPVQTEGEFANGIFVLNEGNFGSGNASVSFVDADLQNVTNNIFESVNAGEPLGDIAQSMGFHEEYAFIVVNVSNKVEVVDRNTFEAVATISEGLENPRYIAFSNGNAYVTNWGDGGDPNDDYIAVIDAASFEIIENIGVEEGPEKIVAEQGNLYVAHQGGWSFNNKISVIDAATNTMVESITVGDVPNALDISNGSLWVSSGGFPSYAAQETAGKITRIDLSTLEIVQEYEFANSTDHPGNLDVENGLVYYTLGNAVYVLDTNEDSLPEEAHLEMEEVVILNGFEVQDSRIYAASANSDYTGNGDLFIYDAVSTDLLTELEVGINPRGVYFNN